MPSKRKKRQPKKKTRLKEIEVGCAVIYRRGKLLISQRRPGDSLGGYWEFPGGKRDGDETFEACIAREVLEEMGVCVRANRLIHSVTHRYPGRHIHLKFYVCEFLSGDIVFHEVMNAQWVALKDLKKHLFPPADRDLISDLVERRSFYFGEAC